MSCPIGQTYPPLHQRGRAVRVVGLAPEGAAENAPEALIVAGWQNSAESQRDRIGCNLDSAQTNKGHRSMYAPRNESEILDDLTALAGSPGYAHAVAYVCHRDNVIYIRDKLKPSDLNGMFSRERLVRTELMTLIGLMVKRPLDLSQQPPDVIEGYVERTDALLQDLHDSMSHPMHAGMLEAVKTGVIPPNPWHGQVMREPIFYGSESAYAFQYRDLAPEKYGADDAWMLQSKGFTSRQAQTIAKAICALTDEKGTRLLADAQATKAAPATWLPAFEISPDEVTSSSGVARDTVEAFFRAFLFSGNNANFKEVGDFNEVAARPLLPTDRGTVLLFSHYALYEALYESPFYWMLDDKIYGPAAAKNRGVFVEQFAARRFAKVFGPDHVHTNLNLNHGKDTVGEADVLVVYGDRLIIVQAKAKKLTIAARKGNDNQLRTDFAAAIQDSYDQGWTFANELLAGKCSLVDDRGNEVKLPHRIKEVFLCGLVSEHYPALAFQANHSLTFQTTEVIRPPLVIDVFFLDTLTEMLATPLRLLSYLKLRVAVSRKLVSWHESTVLGYHLKQNLWLDENSDLVMLEDSIGRDLDAAMIVRRDNQPGDATPVGILTRMRGSRYEDLIAQIEHKPDPTTLELGFHLLSMGERSCWDIHHALEAITIGAQTDGKRHDVTLASKNPSRGVTLHCNPTPSPGAAGALEAHCAMRKYKQRAAQWFGVSVGPSGKFQFGVTLESPWEASDEMEQRTANMKQPSRVSDVLPRHSRAARRRKRGRNDLCHCGSGLKYKKCCLK